MRRAARRYGIPGEDWLDLSTGINPHPWQGEPPAWDDWTRLPEDDDGLAEAAQRYYGAPAALPSAGSQAALQALPHLRPACRAGVLAPSYAEHAQAWRRAGHEVVALEAVQIDAAVERLDVLVLANPNNPDGQCFPPEMLLAWRERLAEHGGWLVVDEAFADVAPQASLAVHSHLPGLIVLRSLGKFFGLAGARVGFALAEDGFLQRLAEHLGPWSVAGASRILARQALDDRAWQEAARIRLVADEARLAELLRRHGLTPAGGCALFQWIETPRAAAIHETLARHGILTRLFVQPPGLRFGLPGAEEQWQHLEAVLSVELMPPRKARRY